MITLQMDNKQLNRKSLLLLLVLCAVLLNTCNADYKIGVGIADCTGPVAEVVFMGYAKSTQKGTGLHLRQFSRAFIIDDGINRMVFVSADIGMIGNGLKEEIVNRLRKFSNNVYTEKNIILSGTHTHSGPGGFLMDLLFDISSFGFVNETFNAYASGITKSIVRAHNSMTKGKIFYNSGELLETNINRSPAAYMLNPADERNRYKYNVDKEMMQLKFVSSDESKLLGVINWYAIHGTSMNNTNRLVSSDNIGYASILLESRVNKRTRIGKGKFVAAFASSNLGDVSPNINGPHCLNTGLTCDDVTSTCDGLAKYCVASGPGKDMFESTKAIGERLYIQAYNLLTNGKEREVQGPVNIVHEFINMPEEVAEYTLPNGTIKKVKGCTPAMGYSFAAGTTDGPGEFNFHQAIQSSNPLWNTIRDFIAPPTSDDVKCHHPKPILVNTGRIDLPYEWQPSIVVIQLGRIGDIYLAAVPGEFTTMSGRRLRDVIKDQVSKIDKSNDTEVIIAGLSNVYSDYIVTPEEYQLQRYEAASTIYGPHTLTIYLSLYRRLVDGILKNEHIESKARPNNFESNLISFVPPVLFDFPGMGGDFGNCVKQPPKKLRRGQIASATFVSGHPRNNLMHGSTFLTIEREKTKDEWIAVLTDANWDTKFIWNRLLGAYSEATVQWDVGYNTKPGTYRIHHYGYYKYMLGGIFPYEGISNNFQVV